MFFKESLQTPWIGGALRDKAGAGSTDLQTASVQGVLQTHFPENFRIFVFPPDIPEELHRMMEKMVFALGCKPDEVSFLSLSEEGLDELENYQGSRNILFFGDQYPGLFGEFIHWSGHKVMKTHGLDLLKSQPELKMQTWEHLKKYGSMQ